MSEADDLVRTHVAADHAVRQARLERLIDDASAPVEIGLEAGHEIPKRQVLGDASALGM
jgi:hypothetical protein